MSTEENKALVHRAMEWANQRNWAAYDETLAPDFVYHHASLTIQGRQAYKQFIEMYFTAFPDGHLTIEDLIAEGDTIVHRQTFHGTHQGTLMGIAPTGKQIHSTGIAITRIENGKAVEEWAVYDDLGLLQQLGVVPAQEQHSS